MYTTYSESLRDQLHITHDEALHEAQKHSLELSYQEEHTTEVDTTGDDLADWLGY